MNTLQKNRSNAFDLIKIRCAKKCANQNTKKKNCTLLSTSVTLASEYNKFSLVDFSLLKKCHPLNDRYDSQIFLQSPYPSFIIVLYTLSMPITKPFF